MKKRIALLALAGSLLTIPFAAAAQDTWPTKPVRILVGFPAGTSTDIIARLYAQRLSDHFKQPFVVDNRTGFGGNLAAQVASKAPADGYTFLMATAANAISHSVHSNLGFDVTKDFRTVSRLASAPNVVVIGPAMKSANIQEFLEAARKSQGQLTFGSAGVGTVPHLSGELLNLMTEAKMTHVPYRGNAQGIIDLADGRLHVVFAPAPTLAGFLKSDRVKALAVTSEKRTPLLPELPTLAEAGLKGFDTSIWYGLLAPTGTPEAAIKAMSDFTVKITNEDAELRASLANSGAEPVPAASQEFGLFLAADVQKWAKVVKFANVKPE